MNAEQRHPAAADTERQERPLNTETSLKQMIKQVSIRILSQPPREPVNKLHEGAGRVSSATPYPATLQLNIVLCK